MLSPKAAKTCIDSDNNRRESLTSFRLVWHFLYDSLPTFQTIYSIEKIQYFQNEFMQFMFEKNISMNWQTHLNFLHFLTSRGLVSAPVVTDEFLIATVQSWIKLDQSKKDSIILVSNVHSWPSAFLGQKFSIDNDSKCWEVRFQLRSLPQGFYFLAFDYDQGVSSETQFNLINIQVPHELL